MTFILMRNFALVALLCSLPAFGLKYELYRRPQIIRGPEVKKVAVGGTVLYECETYGEPTPTLTWDFKGKPLQQNERIHITHVNAVSLLRIKNAVAAVEGEYCCNADDGYFTSSHCGRLKVKRVPEIVRGPSRKSVEVGGHTILDCAVNAYPKPEVRWSHNDKRIECMKELFDNCGSYVLTYSNSLRIVNVKPSDGGWYSCMATNDIGTTKSESAYLAVTGVRKSTSTLHETTPFLDETTLGLDVTSPPLHTTQETTIASSPNPQVAVSTDPEISNQDTTINDVPTLMTSIGSPTAMTTYHPLASSSPTSVELVTTALNPSTLARNTMEAHSVAESQQGHSRDEGERITVLDDLYHESSVDHDTDATTTFIAVFVGTSLFVTCTFFLCCIARKKKRLKRQSTTILKCHHSMRLCSARNLHGEKDTESCLQSLSYPVGQLKIIEELGEGIFGLVFKANAPYLHGGDEDMIVAVKTIRAGNDPSRVEDFNREAELLATFRHDNIVQLLGVCFDEKNSPNQKNISCLLFEYVDGGDLCAFLRSRGPNRSLFQISFADMADDVKEVTDQDKLSICTHIARGMNYLSEKNFIHRDLATRNCLISTANLNVKIADFGLSRRTYESDYYKASDAESVPIRWMAPESILYGKYSPASDVWAFGVTLWEVYTFALQPYFSLTNEEVVCCICQGNLLAAPAGVPTWMYNLMRLCWNTVPDTRPSFSTIYSVLEAIWQNHGEIPMSEVLPQANAENTDIVAPLGGSHFPPILPPPERFAHDDGVVSGGFDEPEYVHSASVLSEASNSMQSASGKESIV